MSGLKSDCRKFSPNVFNKTKCQNCFRIKDSHSAEALESNRALRNVSKCGYLFVAPDWDFNVSVNRTKRWQRRWFVLYDDGELTYALDQFPDTIPQGTIDMNKVLDVSDAEGITGNEFAISITTPEKVHFIKGTSKEESKWWFDVLCKVSPRYISRQKHKRNATFPCGRATIPTPAVINQEYCTEDDMRLNTFSRPKFRSTSEMMQEWIPTANTDEDDVFTTTKDPYIIVSSLNNKINRDVEVHNTLNKLISLPEDIMDESEKLSINEAYEEKLPKDYLSELEESENRRRNRRYLKRENRIQRNQRSRNDGVAKMIPSKSPTKNSQNCSVDSTSPNSIQSSHTSALAAAEKLEYLESIHAKDDKPSSTQKDIKEIETSLEPSAVKNSKQLYSKTNLRKSESLKNIPTETESEMKDHVSGLRRYHSFKGSSSPRKLKSPSGTSSLKRTKSSTAGHPRATSTPISTKPSSTSTSPDCSTNRPPSLDITSETAKEGTFMRTGWLLRQTLTKDWSRHWFVLKDSSLTYYRDPTAEHSGIMDGILDLNQVSTIREQESDKFYAISLRMWDDKKHVLAAETDEFRKMWIQALQYAANLWSSASKEDFICTEIILPEHTFHHDRLERISTPSSLFSLPYTEEISQVQEYSSYSSDDQSEYFSLVDEDEVSDLSSSPRDLPPSPPLNRNVISLVKEKSRTRIGYGSKSNSIHNSSTETTFDDDNHKRSESPQSHDFPHKDILQSKHAGEETTIDSTENQLAMNDVERPVSPITPPVEFMNGSENVPFVKENATISNETKLEHFKNSITSDSRVDHPKIKEKLTEQCSTCLAMRSKLLSAQEEIKKLEKELKEAHANFDNLEMFSYKLTQDMKLKEETYNSQIALMISKIDDLTSKFSTAEKNYRQLKQKTAKSETKERRRSSLKNREGLSITKEYETKLCELEKKMDSIETSFKKENFDEEGSERSFSDCSSRLNESFIATSESSETSTPTDAASSEGRGFFSRLQSLMSKIDKVNALFPVKDNSEKLPVSPKILLPVKSSDELSSLDESDEWYTQSSSDTPLSVKNSDQNISDYPQNLSECQIMLSQKLNSHLEWLKHSLQVICKDKIHSSDIQRDKLNLVDSLASELNELSSNLQSSSFTEQKSLLLFEITKALEKINRTDNFENLLKLNVTKTTYKTIFQTFCIAFAEYGNNELPVTLVSDVPQLDYFCPSISKLFPETFKSSSSFSNFPDRLQSVEEQLENSLNLIGQLKLSKYEQLWNILAEVPVQDDHVKNPPEINSIFNYITSIATDIHRITEIQLCQMPKVLSKTSKLDYMGIPQCLEMFADNLKIGLTNFLNEIRGKCPMVIESTISFHKLKESTRVCIIRLVAELSFLNICNSVLSLLAEYYTKINRDFHTDYFNQGKLLSAFENGASCEMQRDIFYCPQCMTLNNLLCESNEQIQWPDFVRKYNYYNFRKFDKCSTFNFEEPIVTFCANCDNSNFSNSQAKNQKDVCNNVTCVQCDSWIQKFCTSKKQHELEQRSMELKHNAELKQLEECIIKSSEIHEQELLQKQNELLAATLQLQRLKANYEEQKRMLKTFYEEKLNFECESIDESSINESYRAEIEDLKDMFKQGLIAIENSHNRITSEMQKRHSEEITILEAEKEKALELEAQATLTALEAIKRAHAQQLCEKTASIREELLNKFQKEEREKFSCKYANELEKLKAEIFKITEMFSSKCLENVTLEEKVHSLRLQLKEAHNELCNLISKNREINVSFFEGVEASAVSKA